MLKTITQYNKALVPLVVGFFALLSDKIGVQLSIGPEEAVGIIALVTSLLVALIPNKQPSQVTVSIPTETKVIVPGEKVVEVKEEEKTTAVIEQEAPQKPSILRTVSK